MQEFDKTLSLRAHAVLDGAGHELWEITYDGAVLCHYFRHNKTIMWYWGIVNFDLIKAVISIIEQKEQ